MMMLVCKLRRHSSGTGTFVHLHEKAWEDDGVDAMDWGIQSEASGMERVLVYVASWAACRSDEVTEEARGDGRLLQNYSDYPPHAQDSMRI